MVILFNTFITHKLVLKLNTNCSGVLVKSRQLNDRSKSCIDYESAVKILKNNSHPITHEIIRGMLLPNTDQAKECYYWMQEYFHFAGNMKLIECFSIILTVCMIGDHMPNSGEIHLDYMKELDLYFKFYVKECVLRPLQIGQWRWIWKNLFPHVKMREHKDVSTKCNTCDHLNRMRSEFSNPKLKSLVTELHALHRDMYMNERYLNLYKYLDDIPIVTYTLLCKLCLLRAPSRGN